MSLLTINVDLKSAAAQLKRIADILERIALHMGVPLGPIQVPTEPKTREGVADEFQVDTDEDRLKRDLERQFYPDRVDVADEVGYTGEPNV